MVPKDEQFYDQLIGHLAAKGRVKEDAGRGVLVLREFDGRALPPLHLHVTAETFGDHLRATALGASDSYPDIHPIEAAWRLFLVHLEEAIGTAAPKETELVIDDAGVRSRQPE